MSAEPPVGHKLLEAIAVMDTLRSPGGCPWDAQQTHESLVKYSLEEAEEVVAAIGSGKTADLIDELGDLLLQVLFHARVGQDHPPAAPGPETSGANPGPDASPVPADLVSPPNSAESQSAAAWTHFTIDDVAAALIAKLLRRHPHVFGDARADTPEEVEQQWQQIKAAEKRGTLP